MAIRSNGYDVDVLIVGAGPTGLALATELTRWGVSYRIIDKELAGVRESRALAIQPRTLEVLRPSGVADVLLANGYGATSITMHSGSREADVNLFGGATTDTEYPFILFLSQARTEELLTERIAAEGEKVERATELIALGQNKGAVRAILRSESGTETVHARFLVGCDGAHSATRRLAGLRFEGASFPETFALADVEADGIDSSRIHAFLSDRGVMFFFPLQAPATWRIILRLPEEESELSIDSVQRAVNEHTTLPITVRDPVWLSRFVVNSRYAARFQQRRVFVAGDAAHIHSPAGGQGMNIGVQDAINLAWKLALVCSDRARSGLLTSYDRERRPVARQVIQLTNRAFRAAMSARGVVRFVRSNIAPRVAPKIFRLRAVRSFAFQTIGELRTAYPKSPLSVSGLHAHGPRAGERIPDAAVTVDGTVISLHRALSEPVVTVLLCGPAEVWDKSLTHEASHWGQAVRFRVLTEAGKPGSLIGTDETFKRLRLDPNKPAQLLVRPDLHVGYRAAGDDLDGLRDYLAEALRLRQT